MKHCNYSITRTYNGTLAPGGERDRGYITTLLRWWWWEATDHLGTYYSITILQYYSIAILQYYNITILQYHNIITVVVAVGLVLVPLLHALYCNLPRDDIVIDWTIL